MNRWGGGCDPVESFAVKAEQTTTPVADAMRAHPKNPLIIALNAMPDRAVVQSVRGGKSGELLSVETRHPRVFGATSNPQGSVRRSMDFAHTIIGQTIGLGKLDDSFRIVAHESAPTPEPDYAVRVGADGPDRVTTLRQAIGGGKVDEGFAIITPNPAARAVERRDSEPEGAGGIALDGPNATAKQTSGFGQSGEGLAVEV